MNKSAGEVRFEAISRLEHQAHAEARSSTMPYPESAIKTVERFFPGPVLEETGMRQVIKDLDAAYGVERGEKAEEFTPAL
jgi:hypothetical protein